MALPQGSGFNAVSFLLLIVKKDAASILNAKLN